MKRSIFVVLMAVVLSLSFASAAVQPALAQIAPFPAFYVIGLCSAVDYDAVAAKALNLAPADLRLALVSGQVLEDIARSQNVPLDSVQRTLLDAHFTEIDQAISDGLIDAQQAQQLKNLLTNRNQPNPRPLNPSGNMLYPVYGLPPDITPYNYQAVKFLRAAASQLDLKCPDLAKGLVGGRSLVALTTARGGQIGTVIDAMIKAYQDALDQDVKEQLITAAQAKGLRIQLAERVTGLVNQAGQPVLAQMFSLPGSPVAPYPPPYAGAGGAVSGAGPVTVVPLPPVPAPSTGGGASTPSMSVGSTPTPTAAAR